MDINEVEAPKELSTRQINIARAIVENELKEGLTQQDFCRKHSMSSATLAKWRKDVTFSGFVSDLKGEIISSSELQAYEVVKRHILQRVNSANPTDKDIQMFMENFDYVVKYEQQKAMEKLGINKQGENVSNTKSLAEKKAGLLQRLKPDGKKTIINEDDVDDYIFTEEETEGIEE